MKKMFLSCMIVVSFAVFGAGLAYAEGGPRGGARLNFEQMDANGDGVLTMEEFRNQGQAKFAQADTNGDGQLDMAELTAAADRDRDQRIARLMERKDSNGDGMLSLDEMQPRNPGRIFTRADTDGNGEISQEEWGAAKARMRGHGPRNGN